MMDNSEQIARLINDASESGTGAVNRALKELETTHTAGQRDHDRAVTRDQGSGDDSARSARQRPRP